MTTTIAARPTDYKGVRMRSRLEAGFAQWLDSFEHLTPVVWEYEPVCLASEQGQWLPDFVLRDLSVPHVGPAPMDVYVEIKPSSYVYDEGLERRMMAAVPDGAVVVVQQQGEGPLILAPTGLPTLDRVLGRWIAVKSDSDAPFQLALGAQSSTPWSTPEWWKGP